MRRNAADFKRFDLAPGRKATNSVPVRFPGEVGITYLSAVEFEHAGAVTLPDAA